jgi:tetratricopeptide (TPR) repeat protein
MRAGLDSVNVRNRNGQAFTISDVQPYVDFFDEDGTPNDRLLAHYLLGLAYSDHGEAPMALQCYQDAIDCADTTSDDCDYAQLARVYGQMGGVFYYQGLYREMLYHLDKSVKMAWKGGDTLLALRNYEQQSQAYRMLNMRDSLLYICERVYQGYNRFGYTNYAAYCLGYMLSTLIYKKEYDKAQKYMHTYESSTCFFDSGGNIERGREIYYRIKGLYYVGVNKLDSAEFFYRKELRTGLDFNNQHSGALGLAELYNIRHQTDSALKYCQYAYAMNDSIYAQRSTKEIERMQAMYNYTRHQEIAHTKSREAYEEKQKNVLLSIVLFLITLAGSWITFHILKREKVGLIKYRHTLEDLRQVRLEKEALAKHEEEYFHIIAEKDKKIAQDEKIIKKYGKLQYFSTANAERCLKESPSYKAIQLKAIKGEPLSPTDWESIYNMIREYFPGFDDFIETQRPNLKNIEYQTCLLLRLHFKAIDIAGCLSLSKSKISQICTEVMRKTYQSKGSSKELSAKLTKIF